MDYKAIFFDRDGTLTYYNPDKISWKDKTIAGWSGRDFELPYEKMMALFQQASGGKTPWYRNVSEEKDFFLRYYGFLLRGEGVRQEVDSRAKILFDELWCNNDRLPYPETKEVLEYFCKKGYKMGVISDTLPSLEYTLHQLGLASFFTSFTASSLVGAGKPNPIIFNAALDAQGVTAAESVYVDDYHVEADGARELGFTAFLIDRTKKQSGEWVIDSLNGLVEFMEKC